MTLLNYIFRVSYWLFYDAVLRTEVW